MKERGRSYRTLSVLCLIILAGMAGLVYEVISASAAPDKGMRQKGHKECISCHLSNDPDAGEALFPEGLEPSQPCLGCHRYVNSHHPVNFQPDRPLFREDEESPLPLFEDKIQCLTCHQIHSEPKRPKLLRGGPYADRRGICYKCHYDEQYASINVHKMLDSNNQVVEINGLPVCVVCHTSVPKQNGAAVKVKFRAEVAFICWRCHPPMPGSFFAGHFLVRPSAGTKDFMRQSEINNGISLPLLNRGRITCSTCHNPHQEGVIQYGPASEGAGAHDKLRMPPGEICSGCHDK